MTIPYLNGFCKIFKRIVSKHGIKTAFWPGTNIKKLKSTGRTSRGEKKANAVHQTHWKCKNSVYVGENIECLQQERGNIKQKFVCL